MLCPRTAGGGSIARTRRQANQAMYTRNNPSPEYLAMVQMYETLHPPEWWAGLVHGIAMRHTDVSYRFVMTDKSGPRKKLGLASKRCKVNHVFERLV